VSRVDIDQLRAALERRASRLGFDQRRSALLADHFLDAEMRGASGHGAERMRWLHGFAELRPTAQPVLVERLEGMARWDAGGALGYPALAEVIEAELASPPDGARLVVVSDCFPTGRLGYFAELGARSGLVTLVTATSTPRIVHPQGGPPLLGTNPLCLALPGQPATVVDVSMGAVTYGGVLKAAATGQALAEGSALRPDGSHETDPGEITANRAGIAPFGGDQAHKGFALALLVQLLCGSLAGGEGHSAVVLLASPSADGMQPLRDGLGERHVPGEGSLARLERAVAAGSVELPDDLWSWLSADH
jgi:LDH2 family malate/lactate/ureidoglycolate dehydrogenase